jgi:hypothetical protein
MTSQQHAARMQQTDSLICRDAFEFLISASGKRTVHDALSSQISKSCSQGSSRIVWQSLRKGVRVCVLWTRRLPQDSLNEYTPKSIGHVDQLKREIYLRRALKMVVPARVVQSTRACVEVVPMQHNSPV